MKVLFCIPVLLLSGCLNSIDQKQTTLPDGTVAVSVIASHITPFNDAASFTSFRCSQDNKSCSPTFTAPVAAPGAMFGVANGLGSTAVQTAAPFLAPRIIQNQQNGDHQ